MMLYIFLRQIMPLQSMVGLLSLIVSRPSISYLFDIYFIGIQLVIPCQPLHSLRQEMMLQICKELQNHATLKYGNSRASLSLSKNLILVIVVHHHYSTCYVLLYWFVMYVLYYSTCLLCVYCTTLLFFHLPSMPGIQIKTRGEFPPWYVFVYFTKTITLQNFDMMTSALYHTKVRVAKKVHL